MKRRAFIGAIGATAACAVTAARVRGANAARPDELKVLLREGHPLGYFPNVTGPRLLVAGDGPTIALLHTRKDTVLQRSRSKVSLGLLHCARMVADPQGVIHVGGLRDDGLWLLRVHESGNLISTRLATLAEPHAAAGLDLVWTPDGIRIVAPGPSAQTMALYAAEPGVTPRVLTMHAWVNPILRYDPIRQRLHLIFSPWSDASAIYNTVYYMRSDNHGATWLQADGRPYALPLQPNSREHGLERPPPEVVSIIGQPAGGHSNTLTHGLELDADGHPHFLYSFNRPYHLAREPFMRCAHVCWDGTKWSLDRWDGSKWKFGELAPDFAFDVAGGCLHLENRDTIRALVMFKDRKATWLELGISSSQDHGRTWSVVKPLTTDARLRAAHYVAPQWVKRGGSYEFVCAGFNTAAHAPVYRGTIDERRFT